MYSREIEGLARYLIGSRVQSAELCKFLVLETIAQFKAVSICIMGISDDGHLRAESSFGIPAEVVDGFGTVPLSAEIPIIAGFRRNQVAVVTRDQSVDVFPKLHQGAGLPSEIQSMVFCPILPYGGFAMALSCVPKLDEEVEYFFRAVGTLAALHFNRLQSSDETTLNVKARGKLNTKSTLTARQKMIQKFMEKGYTNIQIANEIGYSESLVRQETMAIYAILKIDGRRELLKMSSGS